jgi:hypothetical protein
MLLLHEAPVEPGRFFSKGWSVFLISLVLSLGFSFLLMMVFHIPIFIVGGLLPLLWLGRRRE